MNNNIRKFAEQMQIQLDNNKHKGDINEWTDIKDILVEFEYHKAKLLIELKKGNIPMIDHYLADCGNILMALGNVFNLYPDEPIIKFDENKSSKMIHLCGCGKLEKIDGEHYCQACLKENPFLCS